MTFYIKDTDKLVKIAVRKWLGRHYGPDFSGDILIDLKDGGNYTEKEIIDVLEWCAEYCDEYDCQLFVERGK